MAKLGIDIGNYNVKTSEGIIFKSAISNSAEFGNDFDKLVYNDEIFYIGSGRLEIDYRKFDKENYMPLLLGAICKSIEHEEVELGLGLPIKQYKAFKNELICKLLSSEYNVTFNDKQRRIKIIDVDVFPESVAGIIANYNTIKDKAGFRDIIAIDIGGKTTDIALIVNKKVIRSSQISVGTIDIYNTIKSSLEEEFYDAKIDIEKVQRYLAEGFWYKGEKQDIRFAIKSCNSIFKEIYTELNINYKIQEDAVVIQGGGAELLNSVFSKKIKGLIIDADLFANAKGYKILLK
ncbi:MAG: ParM/StbA family protein [Clostridia bacterium]